MRFEFRLIARPRGKQTAALFASIVAHAIGVVALVTWPQKPRTLAEVPAPRVPITFHRVLPPPPPPPTPPPPTPGTQSPRPPAHRPPRSIPRVLSENPRPSDPAPVQTPMPAPTPARAESADPAPLVTGLSLSSTTGQVAAPIGQTLQARAGGGPSVDPARKPRELAPGYALSRRPIFLNNLSQAEVRRFYPPDARRASLEAAVRVKLLVDDDGSVAQATLLADPGNGFGPAALKVARLYRFQPALIGGRAVATEIEFTIHFELD